MIRAVNMVISGTVQGVFFRATAKKQADKYGIMGYAKNLTNGQVEINAIGEALAIDKLINWSHKGSLFAVVEDVIVTELGEVGENFDAFTIR